MFFLKKISTTRQIGQPVILLENSTHFIPTTQHVNIDTICSIRTPKRPTACGTHVHNCRCRVKTQCTSTKLLTRYIPNRLKPKPQWFPGILKYCSSNNRSFMFTDRTSVKSSFHRPGLASITYWANKSMRPTKLFQIIKTSLFCCEPLVEFLQGLRIVNPGNWMGTKIIHTSS